MNDDALPVFRRLCRMIATRGGRGMTLEQIRDSAGLAEALTGQVPDDWRIREFAHRLELEDEDLEEIMESEQERDGSASLAHRDLAALTRVGPHRRR